MLRPSDIKCRRWGALVGAWINAWWEHPKRGVGGSVLLGCAVGLKKSVAVTCIEMCSFAIFTLGLAFCLKNSHADSSHGRASQACVCYEVSLSKLL